MPIETFHCRQACCEKVRLFRQALASALRGGCNDSLEQATSLYRLLGPSDGADSLVTHITFAGNSTARPVIEFFSDDDGEIRRVTIERSPFCIGRGETTDLRIDSSQVSREHARIYERKGAWFIRDLGSMNGTEVNGKTVSDTLLADGDIIRIVETELTFVASSVTQFQRMVTQPVQRKQRAAVSASRPTELTTVRSLIETALWQTSPPKIIKVVSLRHRSVKALLARSPSAGIRNDLASCCRQHPAARRCAQLFRLRAAEMAMGQPTVTRLLLPVDRREVESPHDLAESMAEIRELLPPEWEVGVDISQLSILDTLRIEDLYRELRSWGLLVTYSDFQGNGDQVMRFESSLPDYLLLSPAMTEGLSTTRQPQRRLESVFAACNKLAIDAIIADTLSEHAQHVCQQIGYDLFLESSAPVEQLEAATCLAAV